MAHLLPPAGITTELGDIFRFNRVHGNPALAKKKAECCPHPQPCSAPKSAEKPGRCPRPKDLTYVIRRMETMPCRLPPNHSGHGCIPQHDGIADWVPRPKNTQYCCVPISRREMCCETDGPPEMAYRLPPAGIPTDRTSDVFRFNLCHPPPDQCKKENQVNHCRIYCRPTPLCVMPGPREIPVCQTKAFICHERSHRDHCLNSRDNCGNRQYTCCKTCRPVRGRRMGWVKTHECYAFQELPDEMHDCRPRSPLTQPGTLYWRNGNHCPLKPCEQQCQERASYRYCHKVALDSPRCCRKSQEQIRPRCCHERPIILQIVND